MKKVILLAILLGAFALFNCSGEDIPIVNDDVSVYVYPDSMTIYYEDTLQFRVSVFNTTDTSVDWYVEGIEEGNSTYGTINSAGLYIAPNVALTFDRVVVKAISRADPTRADSAEILVLDQYQVYVDSEDGDDINGTGAIANKFRTISRALATAISGQTVIVGPGTYNESIGETFPITPTFNVYVHGSGIASTFVEPPTTAAAFSLEDEHVTVEYLTIMGNNKTGTGVEFHGGDGIKRLKLANTAIENFHTAAINTSEADSILFLRNEISDCVFGLVIEQPVDELAMDSTVFANIDSIAIQLISPVTYVYYRYVSIDGAVIGLNLTQGSYAFIQNSTFANIDSVAVLLNATADMGIHPISTPGNNDFSGCSNLCVYNGTSQEINAIANWWPVSDSATIDTLYIYDDDENSSLGAVHFQPIHQ